MNFALDNIWEVVEWITVAEEAVVAQVNTFDAILDLHVSDSDGESFDYKENLG